MSLLNGFDATKVAERTGFTPLPAGDYTCCVAASEEKTTASGTGQYLKLTIEVLDGEHKGRLLFENLNLVNPSAKAVEIAQETLGELCRAINVPRPENPMQLHGKPMVCTVAVKKRKDTGDLNNEITCYSPIGTAPATQPAAAGQPWANR
jgi:hypothetical protein